jgi:hypothetical protein
MTLAVLSKIMEIIVKSYSLMRVLNHRLNRLLNFISERDSENITVFGPREHARNICVNLY